MSYRRKKRSIPKRVLRSLSQLTLKDLALWGGITLIWAGVATMALQYERNKAEDNHDRYAKATIQLILQGHCRHSRPDQGNPSPEGKIL
ncbi:MAG: hypothetical protein AAFY67_11945, partial [Cyanobacteria bacterium J06642_9]